ncbi:sensor histidine kinase [Catenuloplanes sp. NPDC051500]|uniref:sensor histidine kinase n=1 Tax=Catenuloplanes sp. NPDC051500 TaxID=3363959 RepID=UPI003794A9CF
MDRGRALRVTADLVVAGVAAVIGSGLELADPDLATKHVAAPAWIYVLAEVCAAAVLLARRRHPYAAAAVIAAISLFVPAWAALLIPYAVTAHGAGRRWKQWAVITALIVAFLAGAQAWAIDDPFTAPAVMLFSALLGLYFRARRSLVAELTDRAERAERERLLLAEQARADERVRLAGEMHDAVTHRLNLMVLQAGALRVSTTDPAARAAAEELRAAGCQALAELRDLVGVLRTGGPVATTTTAPADEPELAALVDESRAVGVHVRLTENGDPGTVAPAVRRTLFRVVQESLTNVRKHAPGADVDVSVRYDGAGVRVAVANTRPSRAPAPDLATAGGGTGLDGLRHRVEMVGGTLAAAATPDGGFSVRATLPAYVPTAAFL